MAFEGNIAGLLGMSNKSDGTGDYQSQRGNYKERLNRRERQYYQMTQNIDPDTGEVLDFKPNKNLKNPYKMANFKSYKAPSFKMPNPKSLIDLAIVGAIGLGGFILYNKVFKPFMTNSAIDKANSDGEKAVGADYVNTQSSQIKTAKATATSLGSQGYSVGSLHQGNANLLHTLMDREVVDHDEIIKVVKGMSVPTIKLVSIAYGNRSLPNYAKSWIHVFNVNFTTWGKSLFSDDVLTGKLVDHLTYVLYASECKQITSWLDAIKTA
ncbi:hypothetical protein [Mucilaginibacter flavus]|uniref:hypothetical protein n=1 Tax=Mucilaginibacter flavus TaxID=931504 RepID=UPI0025B5F409|nr:hypothetical protein [Mucilaginibacter flavus]MDN3584734.1 hypothetical protein [Mucilaginibacter flavus]